MGERTSAFLAGRWGWLAVAAIAVFFLLLHPIGFTGGGADDSRYLEAARCWAGQGAMCLPENHWASRWPALAPIAAGIALLGEGRTSIGLGTLAGWMASIALVGLLGRLWFDRATGLLAAAVFASIPLVSAWATQPSVDLIELAFQLGALALATVAYRRQSVGMAVATGVVAALAVQSRETSLIFCGVAALAWLALDRKRRGVLLWALAGFGGAMAVEMAAYFAATGDPLARYRLSLGHVAIPSPELQPWVDTSRSPLLNPDYIAGWKRVAGIELWWPIDPWLNLLASPVIGLWLIAAVGLGPIHKGEGGQTAGRIALGAGLVAVLLVYLLAVDPKPRMFLLLAVSAALVIGWALDRRLVPMAAVALLLGWGAMTIIRLPNTRAIEQAARDWIAAHPGAIESDPRTVGALTLLPEARALPPLGSGRPLRLVLATTSCAKLARDRATVVAERRSAAGTLCLVSPTKG
ncbi:MAG: glycosyltransferase family 39 protein [Sphingomicrobium sp.]